MKKIERTLPFLFLTLVFVIIIFSFRDNPFSNVLSGHDSSMFLYFGKGMSEGLVPYKDMLDHKGPVLFIIEYLAVLVGFGNYSIGIWIVECFFLGITLIYLYKTCFIFTEKKSISTIAVTLLTPLFILCYDGGNYSEEFALLFISVAFYLFSKIIILNRKTQLDYVLIGFLGAATFFIRVNMISLWLVYCLFLLSMNLYDKKISILSQQIKGIFIGGAALTLLIVIYSFFQNNLKEMIQQAFVMNLLYSESDLIGKFKTTLSFIDLLLKTGLFPLVVIFFVSLFANNKRLNERVYLVLCVYFVVNFLTVILSGRYYTHYLITQFAPLVVVIALSIQFILSLLINRKKFVFALITMLVIILPSTFSAFKTYNWSFNTNKVNSDKDQIELIASFIKKNSFKNDAIYVHNINANIYLLSNRYSNSRFFVLPSVNYDKFPEMKNEFSKEMESNPPKFVVVRKDSLAQKKSSSNLNSAVFKVLDKRYHVVNKINSESYLLYEIIK